MKRHGMCVLVTVLCMIMSAPLVMAGETPVVDKAGAAEKQAVSFMPNGSFEKHKDGKVEGWGLYTYPQREDQADFIHLSDEKVKDGEWALKLDAATPPKKPDAPDETCLVLFNGTADEAILDHKGEAFLLTGWLFVEPDMDPARLRVRIRMYGKDENGKNIFLGDMIRLYTSGKPGEWVRFEEAGVLKAEKDVTRVNFQCGWDKLDKGSVQYLDDLRLVLKEEVVADK